MPISVNGVNLNTLAKNIDTKSGRMGIPDKRGSNRTVSGRSGSIQTKKRFSESMVTLSMWVQGCQDDGTIPEGGSQLIEFQRNVDALTLLFSADNLVLESTMPNGTVRRIRGEVMDAMDFSMSGLAIARFAAVVVCPDVFWESQFEYYSQWTTTGTKRAVEFAGSTAPIEDAIVRFTGPCTNPYIIAGVTTLQYRAALAAGQWVEINTKTWTVTGGGGHTANPNAILATGDARWLVIPATSDPQGPLIVTGKTDAGTALTARVTARQKFMVG